MIEFFAIITEGGFVLYSYNLNSQDKVDLIDQFLHIVFLEGHLAKEAFVIGSIEFHWLVNSRSRLVYIVACQKLYDLPYAKSLLSLARKTFENLHESELDENVDSIANVAPFDGKFHGILKKLEESENDTNVMKSRRSFEDTKKFKSTLVGVTEEEKAASLPETSKNVDSIARKMDALQVKGAFGRRLPPGLKAKLAPKETSKATEEATRKKSGKTNRTWLGKVSKEEEAALDFCEKEEPISPKQSSELDLGLAAGADVAELEVEDVRADDVAQYDDGEASDSELLGGIHPKPVEQESKIFSFFKSLAGQKPLTEEDTREALKKMKENLIQKNVAAEIADQICGSVDKTLIGKCTGTFQNVTHLIKEGTELAIRKILTPKTSSDLFMEIFEAKALKEPYVITFIGVNGVGKSTNLSKLRVHVRNLTALNMGSVELFEKGYGKDAAGIAKEAIQYAKAHQFDVVLIDTAGRMQDNEPLMRALAKLVSVNQPDKIIFVGEALVGNEAIDQLTKFNRALADYSESTVRRIDGVILTKFDTIDEKVGAALSMAYISGSPILFVGTGQTYMDLKKMNVKSVVKTLL